MDEEHSTVEHITNTLCDVVRKSKVSFEQLTAAFAGIDRKTLINLKEIGKPPDCTKEDLERIFGDDVDD